MINAVINDLITNTKLMLNNLNPSSIEDIRKNNSVTTKFSDDFESEHIKMKQFLNSNLYKHAKVIEMTERAEIMINKIFESYASNEKSLPESFNHINREPKQANKIRAICDYIAGMTDRFAIAEYERLIQL
jgi:dGTPase